MIIIYYLVLSVCFFTFYRPVAFFNFSDVYVRMHFVFLMLYCFLGCIECYFYFFFYYLFLLSISFFIFDMDHWSDTNK